MKPQQLVVTKNSPMTHGKDSVAMWCCIIFIILLISCAKPLSDTKRISDHSAETNEKITLRVALHPYIPDAGRDHYKSLEQFIKYEFSKQHPSINLILRHIDQSDNFYNISLLTKWLSTENSDGYDIVEPDTILLGELVATGVLQPWPRAFGQSDWYPVAARAVLVNNSVYAIPHILAGHFLMTRDLLVASASNVTSLSAALRRTPPLRRPLVGNLLGSWNMPALYLDAWMDSNPRGNLSDALNAPLDTKAINGLRELSELCEFEHSNPCWDGSFHGHEKSRLPAEIFARGEANAYFGYSEQLHFVVSVAQDDPTIKISSLTIGDSSRPVFYVDAFVLRANTNTRVLKAANFFVNFMNSPHIQEHIMLSLDTEKPAKPRYLIPATMSAFEGLRVKRDRHYSAIRQDIEKAVPFPNIGVLSRRAAMRDQITAYLEHKPKTTPR